MEGDNTSEDLNTPSDVDSLSNINKDNETIEENPPNTEETDQETTENTEASNNENEAENTSEATSNMSRELKLLLALSKASNMDTNICHKRKSIENTKYKDFATKCSDDTDNESKKKSKSADLKDDFPVTAESELLTLLVDPNSKKTYESDNHFKRKRSSTDGSPVEGASENSSKKSRKPLLSDDNLVRMFPGKDRFCWRCHHDNINIACETCPRAYHQKCLKQTINDPVHWPCPECVGILKAENTQTRSRAMKGMSLEHLCSLLKFACKRMIKCHGTEPFMHPVCDKTFPDYKNYIIQPMDLSQIQKNIKLNNYGSTQAFEADAKWILHNSIIFNSYQSKLTSVAKQIYRICKQEMVEIENCPSCYLNANTKTETWFVEVCPKPHILVWAKLKGFPYWPAKAMCVNPNGMVDVRFFGAHDRSWVSYKDCYLFSQRDPNTQKHRKHDIDECLKELELYIENLKNVYGEFHYAPFKTLYDPDQNNYDKQIQIFLPKYRLDGKYKKFKIKTENLSPSPSPKPEMSPTVSNIENSSIKTDTKDTTLIGNDTDSFMEGYGTDDENSTDINFERRKRLMRLTSDSCDNEDIVEDEQDDSSDTQVRNELVDKEKSTPNSRRSFDSNDSESPKAKLPSSNISELSGLSSNSLQEKPEKKSCDENVPAENPLDNGIKAKLVQIELENTELSIINSSNKLTITEQLIKRLQGENSVELVHDTVEENSTINSDGNQKSELNEYIIPPETQVISSTSNSPSNNFKKTQSPVTKEISIFNKNVIKSICDKINATPESEVTSTALTEKNTSENVNKNIEESVKSSEPLESDKSVPEGAKNAKCDKICVNKNEDYVQVAIVESLEDSDIQDPSPLSKSQLDQDMIKNIIHSSLKDITITSNITLSTAQEKEKTEPQTGCTKINETESHRNESKKRKLSTNYDKTQSPPLKCTKIILSQNVSSSSNDTTHASECAKTTTFCEPTSSNFEEKDPLEIKSEPESETELNDPAYMDAKRKYLSALNISERSNESIKKPQEIRTRSKTEDIRSNMHHEVQKTNPTTDNISKVIDSVASNSSTNEMLRKKNINKAAEIYVKPFSQLQAPISFPITMKHKARKSFPIPNYAKPKIMPKINVPSVVKHNVTNGKPENVQTTTSNIYVYTTQPISSNVSILPPNQTIAFNTTLNTTPVFTVLSQSPTTSTKTPSQVITYNPITGNLTTITSVKHVNYNSSQNYIPQKDCDSVEDNNSKQPQKTNLNSAASTNNNTLNNKECNKENPNTTNSSSSTESALGSVLTENTLPNLVHNLESSENNEPRLSNDFSVLNTILPENICKSLSNALCRPPPKLKPRPPGPLSNNFEECPPSSAGPVTSKINSISHRLGDYFRGMLVELLEEVGKTDSSEATITALKLEIEGLKHKHAVEINEIKNNITTTLLDIQKSIVEDREKIIQETKAQCEVETIKRIEETKSKQWCSNCSKEAQFYCCWNTSYCDYPCQQKHWSKHMSKCTQNLNSSTPNSSQATQSTKSPALKQNNQQKVASKIIAKPTKVYINRAPGKNIGSYKSGSVNQLTLVESTPGNFELQGIGPIAVSGKLVTNNIVGNKFKSIPTVTSFVTNSTNIQQVKSSASSVLSPKISNVQPTLTIEED